MSRYPTFETISIIDGNIQRIEYHQARFEYTLENYFHCRGNIKLSDLIQIPQAYRLGTVRCRIDYNAEQFDIHFYPYLPKSIHSYQCVYVEELDYAFKYSERKPLEQLKTDTADEIIIIKNGVVSDCSIGNLLFLKAEKWYSPSDYLLKGTQLSYLLEKQQVSLTTITAKDIHTFEKVMMINALNPFDEKRAISVKHIRL